MDSDFQELKQQLAELSETVNSFQSEVVQLRIVELFFDQRARSLGLSEGDPTSYDPGPGSSDRRRTGKANGHGKPSASGAVAVLKTLVEGDFFNEKRTIGDVVKKCEQDLEVRYRSNAFSGPLSRYARTGLLMREKNADGNYVYFKR